MPSVPAQALKRIVRLAVYVAERFRADGALNIASSLSYTSLLSLVPLLAIGLAILAAFPAFDSVREQLQQTVFHYFVPDVGQQVQRYLTSFVSNAGKLTAAGVVGIAFTAVMLLVTIESSLNQIFRVTTARSPMSRLLVYWTALTLGPLLLGTSFSLSASFLAAGDWAAKVGFSALARMVTLVLPTVLMMLSFALLYLAGPNRRVRPADAVIGGFAAGLGFAFLRWAFTVYLANAHSYQSIYGAVAAVPIFLFWMYLCWAVVLFGAELTAALPEWRTAREDNGAPLPARRRLALALTLLASLLEESQNGGQGCGRAELLNRTGEGERPFRAVLDRLCQGGYVVPTASGRYVLGRDLTGLTVADLVHILDLGLGYVEAEDCGAPWMRLVAGRLAEAAKAEAEALDLPLRTVLEEASRMDVHTPPSPRPAIAAARKR